MLKQSTVLPSMQPKPPIKHTLPCTKLHVTHTQLQHRQCVDRFNRENIDSPSVCNNSGGSQVSSGLVESLDAGPGPALSGPLSADLIINFKPQLWCLQGKGRTLLDLWSTPPNLKRATYLACGLIHSTRWFGNQTIPVIAVGTPDSGYMSLTLLSTGTVWV